MASIRADGHEVPLVLPLGEGGFTIVSSHLLHVRFGFVLSSIYVEEEVLSDSGRLKESIHMPKLVANDGHVWHLFPERYRTYGLSSLKMNASNDIIPRQSNYSTVNMPLSSQDITMSLDREHITIASIHVPCIRVKQEALDPIIDISSESKGECPSHPSFKETLPCTSLGDVVKPTTTQYGTPSTVLLCPLTRAHLRILVLQPWLVSSIVFAN